MKVEHPLGNIFFSLLLNGMFPVYTNILSTEPKNVKKSIMVLRNISFFKMINTLTHTKIGILERCNKY